MYDNIACIGIIQMFLGVCKCDCKSPCEECNNECKNYAIVLKCITEKVFECNFIENAIPTILTYC